MSLSLDERMAARVAAQVAGMVAAQVAAAQKGGPGSGDLPGHEFHGNQWTGGSGNNPSGDSGRGEGILDSRQQMIYEGNEVSSQSIGRGENNPNKIVLDNGITVCEKQVSNEIERGNELMAYELSKQIGANVPVTSTSGGNYIRQEWSDGELGLSMRGTAEYTAALKNRGAALLDSVMAQMDRNLGNFLIKDGEPILIDNGNTAREPQTRNLYAISTSVFVNSNWNLKLTAKEKKIMRDISKDQKWPKAVRARADFMATTGRIYSDRGTDDPRLNAIRDEILDKWDAVDD